MKTESELRRHRDALLAVATRPCKHDHSRDPVGHLLCATAQQHFAVYVSLLSWVLGENEEYERLVEEVAAAAYR